MLAVIQECYPEPLNNKSVPLSLCSEGMGHDSVHKTLVSLATVSRVGSY